MELFEVDSPADFSDPQLRSLDELLRCPICCDIMNTATLLPKCSHNFCSLCIRRHIELKKQCPVCTEPCTESSLLSNRMLNQLVNIYTQLRPRLLTLESGTMDASIGNLSNIEEEPRTPNITLERSSSSAYKHTALTTSSSSPALPTAVQSSKSPVKMNSLFPIVKSSKHQIVGVKTVGEASSYQSVASASAGPLELNECPVCAGMIPSNRLNSHLDQCLQRKEREATLKRSHPGEKRLPKLVWSFLTEKKLRQHCKEYSLSTKGKKPELTKRLKEYTLRYNAQCDADVVKSKAELVRDVERAEVMYKSPVSLVNNMKTHNDRAVYSKKHDGQFVKLINAARKTNQKTNEAVKEEDEIEIISGTTPPSSITILSGTTPPPQRTSSLLSFLSSKHSNCKQQDPKPHLQSTPTSNILQSTPTKSGLILQSTPTNNILQSTPTNNILQSKPTKSGRILQSTPTKSGPILQSTPTKSSISRSKHLSFNQGERELLEMSQACLEDLDDEFDDLDDFSLRSPSPKMNKKDYMKSKLTKTPTKSSESPTKSSELPSKSSKKPANTAVTSTRGAVFAPRDSLTSSLNDDDLFSESFTNALGEGEPSIISPEHNRSPELIISKRKKKRKKSLFDEMEGEGEENDWTCIDHEVSRLYQKIPQSQSLNRSHTSNIDKILLKAVARAPDTSMNHDEIENISPGSSPPSLRCTQNVRQPSPTLSLILSPSSSPSYSPKITSSSSRDKIFDSPPGDIPSLDEDDLLDIESLPASPTIGILTNHQSPSSPVILTISPSQGGKRSSGEIFFSSRKRGRKS